MHRYWWNLALKVSHTWTYITVYRGRSKLSLLYRPLKIHHQSDTNVCCNPVRKYSCVTQTMTQTWFSGLSYDAVLRWFLQALKHSLFLFVSLPQPCLESRLTCLVLQFWMSAVATTMPIPSGAFMPVFILGEQVIN